MIVQYSLVVNRKKEGGTSRETPNRDSHRRHHVLFDACRSGLESIIIR